MVIQVVAVHAHVDAAHRDGMTPDTFEQESEPFGQVNAPALNADDCHHLAVVIALGNLVSDASQDPVDGLSIEDSAALRHKKTRTGRKPRSMSADGIRSCVSFATSRDRLKGLSQRPS